MGSLKHLAAPVALFTALVHGYANPGACSGACVVSDPTLIQRTSDKTYFRFSTGNEISYASATNIAGPWTSLGSVLPGGSIIDLAGNTDLWVCIPEENKTFGESSLSAQKLLISDLIEF